MTAKECIKGCRSIRAFSQEPSIYARNGEIITVAPGRKPVEEMVIFK